SITRLDNGLCELNFDNGDGSVNVFNRQTVNELSQALDHLEKSEGITGLLVTSGKNVFIVGADITEFTHAFSGDQTAVRGHMWPNNENFNRLEALPFPVVVAINGYALGGGFEFCLACDFRVMSSAAVAGFPEVSLGLIPGWGGTARTPRLAGFEKGVQWVAQGAHQNADTALNDGLVDAVASPETLRDDALALLEDAIAGKREYQSGRKRKLAPLDIDNADLSEQSEAALKQLTKQFGPHYPAHRVAVEVITKAASMVRDDALEAEFDAFIGLAQSPEGRALVGNFLNDQYMNGVAKKYASSATVKTRRAGVLGAGIMGGGIAWQNAYKGIPSVMKDIDQQALDQGMEEARGLLARQTSRGRLSEEQAESILNDIQPTLEYEPLADVDLVIEAVVEKEAVKKTVLSEVEALVEDDTLLASNTSSISISGLASALQRPENFCGIHFFNPVHAMPLVEVVRGDKTVDETVARA
ncbi:MAG: 3-hydroxyacyl-CoA dehydrogenase NAD-binding domain-containing protein, partial [Pseudomonadales bacterium]